MYGPSVVAYLNEKEPSLRSIDHTFVIEISFFSSMVGEGGEAALQKRIRVMMPTETNAVSPKDMIIELRKLSTSELYKFLGPAVQ